MAYNWQQALGGGAGGALSGAGIGATVGSVVPGIGTGIGAGIGALGGGALGSLAGLFGQQPQQQMMQPQQQIPSLGGEGNMFSGYGAQTFQLPRFDPQQQNALQQLLQRGLAGSDFGPIEQQARSQFSRQTVPGLAERFSSLGSGGSQRSSAFQGALGAAGAGLEENLAALRSQYGLQQAKLGLSPMFENIYQPAREGIAGPLAQGGSQAATQMFPLFLQWLQQYLSQQNLGGTQQNPQSIRQQNIQQGYQPLPRPTPITVPSQMANLPQLKGL